MRKVFDFHGGIHPAENKHQSVRTPIADAGIPPELIIPLSQHIGAPARPVVSIGERVLKGQMIAEARGFVSVPVHAPTSGTVHAIEDRLIAHPSGYLAPCIVITSDGQDEWAEHSGVSDYQKLETADLIGIIRDAGIAGMGGAGFPSAVKLSVKSDTQIKTLIINGTECEPYITADDILMREQAYEIIEGTKILRQIIAPKETLIGVEDNKPEGIAALRAAAQGTDIEIVTFPTKYPSGGEKQLVEILTGKQVPSGGLPSQVGVVCQNIGSTVAIFNAVVHGQPLISRITTVTGESVHEPQNFEVLIGTPVQYLIEKAGYQSEKNKRLIMGGPMMGFTIPDTDVPVVKTTNCLLAPSETELSTPPPAQACIRCGMCAEVCPASLLPQQMFWFAQGKEFEKLEEHNLFDCIECGACSFACPSHIPLVQYYRASKAEILQMRRDHEIAEQSRIRFEARQQRLEHAEEEKEAKRAARKVAAQQRAQAAEESGEEDPIQAAIERQLRLVLVLVLVRKVNWRSWRKPLYPRLSDWPLQRLSWNRPRQKGSDLVGALQTGVDKTRDKLTAAEQALKDCEQRLGTHSAEQPPVDAAQAAIERAMQARTSEASLSPQEKARLDLGKLQNRLKKSQAVLIQSRENAEEDKVIDALESTVARLTEKINAVQQQLNAAEDA